MEESRERDTAASPGSSLPIFLFQLAFSFCGKTLTKSNLERKGLFSSQFTPKASEQNSSRTGTWQQWLIQRPQNAA